jgi:hypothetical protein
VLVTAGRHDPTDRKADELWWDGIGALVIAAGFPLVSAATARRRF